MAALAIIIVAVAGDSSETAPEAAADPIASASASANSKKKKPNKRRPRVDIYDGLDQVDDPYQDGIPPPRRKSAPEPDKWAPDGP